MATSSSNPQSEKTAQFSHLDPSIFESLPPEVRTVAQEIVEHAKFKLESGGELQATIFLSRPNQSAAMAVVLDTSSVVAKEASITHVRQLAAMQQSTVSVFISESWGLSKEDAPKHEAIMNKYGSLANYPGRLDIFYVHVETTHGVYAAQAQIKPLPPSKKKRTVVFTDKFFMATAMEGRMAGVLPPPAEKNSFH